MADVKWNYDIDAAPKDECLLLLDVGTIELGLNDSLKGWIRRDDFTPLREVKAWARFDWPTPPEVQSAPQAEPEPVNPNPDGEAARCTARGDIPENPNTAPVPTNRKLADGQHADHWTMCPTELAKNELKRPVRHWYIHVGPPGPKYPLRDLTPEEHERYDKFGYIKFEQNPGESEGVGMYWTQERLDRAGKGCNAETRMPDGCAQTYARDPSYYGSTFCAGCGQYRPVGAYGEFVWRDAPNERVGI